MPPKLTETVEVVFEVTLTVFTVNVADVFPAGIDIIAGAVAEVLLLVTAMLSPPTGAGELMTTVPVEVLPPVTEVGLSVTETNCGGKITREAVRELPPAAAVKIAIFCVETATVFTTKVFDVFPAGMVSVAGTIAAGSLVDRLTTNPPVAADELKVTVAIAVFPPRRLVGLTVIDCRTGDFTVKLPNTDRPP